MMKDIIWFGDVHPAQNMSSEQNIAGDVFRGIAYPSQIPDADAPLPM